MDIKQITPSYARHLKNINENKLNFNNFVVQKKYDGERLLLHYVRGELIAATTRRISKKTNLFNEVSKNIPNLAKINSNLDYTILDGEIYGDSWSEMASIMQSLPEKAIELQEKKKLKFKCFDCVYYDSKDVRQLTYSDRLKLTEQIVETCNNQYISLVESKFIKDKANIELIMDEVIQNNGEGIVIKDITKTYDDKMFMFKLKKEHTVDCVVYNIVQGRGKYFDTIGALKIGYYDEKTKEIIHICNVSPGTDSDRNLWRDNWSKLRNSVVEIKCQEITKTSLRHPILVRIRYDKSYEMCIKDTIFNI